MRFTAYISKKWLFFLLALIGLFAGGISFFWGRLVFHHQIIVGTLLAVAILLVLIQMATTAPVIVADENGLTCYPRFYRTIAWEDVKVINRVPRVEKVKIGKRTRTTTSFTEAWRPVDVYITGIEKYSKLLSGRLHKGVVGLQGSTEIPGAFRLRLEFSGTTGDSAKLMEVLEYYMAENRRG